MKIAKSRRCLGTELAEAARRHQRLVTLEAHADVETV
jgi:hypothetical protein